MINKIPRQDKVWRDTDTLHLNNDLIIKIA